MTKGNIQNIMVSGLACSLPHAEGLAQFWADQFNASEATGESKPFGKVIDLLRDTIDKALLDAGMTEDSSLAGHIDLVILLDSKNPIPDGLISPLNEELKVSRTVSVASMATLPQWLKELRSGQREALVLAAVNIDNIQDLFQQTGTTSVGVVVLQQEAGPFINQPYASIKALAESGTTDLNKLYAAAGITPAQVGMLELFSKERQKSDSEPFSTICSLFADDDKQRLRPLGFYPADNDQSGAFSWLVALIKTVLCLHNKIIPPAGHGKADMSLPVELPFFLNRESRPWINDTAWGSRIATVSCGYTPTGHCILEEYNPEDDNSDALPRPFSIELDWDSELILLAATEQAGLIARVASLLEYLDQGVQDGAALKDVAVTMTHDLDPQEYCRLAIVCSSLEELLHYLQIIQSRFLAGNAVFDDIEDIYYSPDARKPGKIACIFPGQGFPGLLGPYADHLFALCQRFPAIREVFDSVEKRDNHPQDPDLTSHIFFPPTSLPDAERNRLRQRLAAPRLADFKNMKSPRERDLSSFGISVANRVNWILLQELGVKADMIFGQSHGELSALCAAGCLDFLPVIATHWQIEYDPEKMEVGRGRLVLAGADAERLAPLLQKYEDVTIAVHVSPSFQILGGDGKQLENVVSELRKAGVWTQFLPYPAIHTPRFTSLRTLFEPFLKNTEVHPFKIPVYSGMICDLYPQTREEMLQTMVDNIDHPLYLWQTTRKMYEDGGRIFIQVGGGATMHTQARTNIGKDDVVPLALDVDYRSAIQQLNHLCAALFINGKNLNFNYLYSNRNLRLLDIKSDAGQVVQKSASAEPGMPFIGKAIHFVENQEIVIERVLDLAEDHFLAHHIFINAPDVKPINARSPVVPLTVSMELMAEAAACLAPGYGLLGFENIKTSRWIELEDSDTLLLQISARVQHVDAGTGIVRIGVAVYLPQQERPVVEAIVRFGQQYYLSVDLQFSEEKNLRPYPVSAADIYRERRLFHGPLFQCISGQTTLGDNSVHGELTVLPKDKMFSSQSEPELLTDPILLDGVGQLIGLWAIDKGVYVFPITIRQAEFYCPTPPVGTRVPVKIEISEFSSKFLYADVEIQDGSGHVWMRIQGWGDWVFRWTERIYNFWRKPTQYCTSQALKLEPPADIRQTARFIAKSELRDMDLTFMARFYLHVTEMDRFRELAKNPERQLHWLLGRIAVKDAVRRLLVDNQAAEMLHPASFAIENDALGRPLVKKLPGKLIAPQVSISHSHSQAVALAGEEAVAIDLEEIVQRDPGFLESFTTEDERQLLQEMGPGGDKEWLTRLWCAKEVVGKLLGTGVDAAPQKFRAVVISDDGNIIISRNKDIKVTVHTLRMDDFIIAFATGKSSSLKTGKRKTPLDRQQGRVV